ncbi:MAG: GAF domain-containing protein [Anaerolineae bacterium]
MTYQVADLAEPYTGRRLKPGEGLVGRVFAQKQILAVDDYLTWNGMSTSFDDAPFRAALAVPMMWRGQVVGVLVATRSQPGRPYLPGEQRLAELLAGQAAAVIQNARLLADAQARAEQLAVANEVGQTVISVLDVDAVLLQIVDTIKERLGYFFVGILLLEGEHLVFRSGSLIGDSDTRWEAGELRLDLDGYGLTVAVANRGESILVNDVSQDSRYGTVEGLEPVRAELDTPIRAKGEVIGVLTVQSDRMGSFDRSDQQLLESLASQAGVAIENARLFAEAEDALAEMEALYNTSRLLASARDLQQVLAAVAEGMYVAAINRAVLWEVESAPAEQPGGGKGSSEPVAVLLAANWYSGEGNEPRPVGTRLPVETFPVAEIILAPSEIFVEDVEKDGRLNGGAREALLAQKARALAILPLWVGRRQIGVLMLVAEKPHRFTPREMRPYRSLAGQMAVVIENRQLFEQTEAQLASLGRIQTALAELNAAFTFDDAIDALLPQVAAIGQADRVRMYLIDGTDMTCVGTHSITGQDQVQVGDRVSLEDYPLTNQVVATGRPMSIGADDPRLQPHAREEYAAAGLAANATIPLIGREGVVGVLSLNRSYPALPFGEQEVGLVQTLANQATTVLEKSQLFEEAERRTTELQSLYETSLRMSTHLETTDLLTYIVEQATALLGAETAGFYLYESGSDELVFSVATGYFTEFIGQRLRPGEGLAGRVFRERRAITVEDYASWSGRAEVYGQEERLGMVLAVPLLGRDAVLGVLDIAAGRSKAAFEERDLWMAELFAAQAATSLENARLFGQIQARAEEQATLRGITETVSRALDMQSLLDTSLEQAIQALGFDAGLVSLYEQSRLVLSAHRNLPEPMARHLEKNGLGGTLCEHVFTIGEAITIGDVRDGAPVDVEPVVKNGLLAYAGAPLSARGEQVGTLCLFGRQVREAQSDERTLLEAIGAQIGLGIGNVRLFEETQARAEELAVLNEMGRALTAELDVEEVLDSIYRYLSRLLDTTNFYVALYDAEADEISFPFVAEAGERIRWASRRSGRGLTEYVMRTAEPLLIEAERAVCTQSVTATCCWPRPARRPLPFRTPTCSEKSAPALVTSGCCARSQAGCALRPIWIRS